MSFSDWKEIPLEEAIEKLIDYRGKTPKKTVSGIPLITAKIVKDGKINTPQEFIDEDDYEAWMVRGFPKKGDVVLTTEAPLGEVASIDDENIALAQRIVVLRGKKGLLDNTYLKYHLMSHDIQHQLQSRASGSTVLGIKQSELRKIILKTPPMKVQQKIADNLDLLYQLSKQNETIFSNLDSIISALFRSWFIDFDPVKAKSEGKSPYGMDEETSALFPDTLEDSELGPIPAGWRVSSVSKICKMSSGGTPSRSEEEYFSESSEGYPWLASRELNGNIIHDAEEYISELGLKNSSAKLFPQNSVAMAMYGATAGRIGYFAKPMTTSQAVCVMIANKNICLPKYLYFLLESESWKIVWMNATGGAQPNISQQIIAKHRIVLPPLEIIQKFESVVDELFANIDTTSIQSKKLSEIRDALLPRLMSGELSFS